MPHITEVAALFSSGHAASPLSIALQKRGFFSWPPQGWFSLQDFPDLDAFIVTKAEKKFFEKVKGNIISY